MNVLQLDDGSLGRLAVLHCSVMHTLLSDLGFPIVLKYYQVARSDTSVVGMILLDSSDEIVGWAIGSPDPSSLNSRLRQPVLWFFAQMMRVAVTRPLVLKQLVSSVLASSSEMEMKKDAIELTYIGVSSAHQGKGLGRELLHKFVEESRSRGYHSVVLSVEEENKAAVALYEKNGFNIIRSFSEGRYRRHRMEFALA
jgi:ribosomal protein S18 acetylase RimI-like enzyme